MGTVRPYSREGVEGSREDSVNMFLMAGRGRVEKHRHWFRKMLLEGHAVNTAQCKSLQRVVVMGKDALKRYMYISAFLKLTCALRITIKSE